MELRKKCKNFWKRNKEVLDVVIFGSFLGNNVIAKDIDISLITSVGKEKSLKLVEGLEKELGAGVHVTFNCIKDLFFKKESIWLSLLHEGISLITMKKLSGNLFLESKVMFVYSLSKLMYKDKVRFFYALKGRTDKGILEKTKSIQLAKGVFLTPLEYDKEIQEFFRQWGLVYKRRRIFIEE